MPTRFFATLVFMAAATPALAHPGHASEADHSFLSGLLHPITGLDHILAMVAVGLWAASLGGRSILLVPAGFAGFMAAGFALAVAGVPLPYVEPMILGSVVVLGLLVAAAIRLPAVPAALLVGLFATFHGHAHGSEMGEASALTYGAGFLIATIALHAAGIRLASALSRLDQRDLPVRALGAVTAFTGALVFVAG
ncbi:MAG: HupE/UreJ family protein [Aliihoeflea sp.]|uniref:HupE/UreJ family protein n=1 Tax=Aliihoeflea sp. TaxID=2608088 RepID=UPI004034A828